MCEIPKTGCIILFQRILPHYRHTQLEEIVKVNKLVKIIYGQDLKKGTVKTYKSNNRKFLFRRNYYLFKKKEIYITAGIVNIIKDKPAVVVAEGANGNLSIIILVLLRIIYKYKLLLWSFGYKPDYGFNPRKRLADTYRLMTYNLVDGIIFYSNQGKQQASKYLNNHEKLFVANNTIDTNQESVIYANLKILGKSQIRSDLGIESKKMVLYIGRLIKDKQVDHLLNSFSLVEAITGDVLLVLIGDGPEKDNLHQLAIKLNLKNILLAMF